jgi:putative MATE family efflux protein
MRVILYGNVITHLYFGLNNILRASGYPSRAMVAMLTSVIINCFLNALFIFVFGWGIKGSAWATVAAQVIALAIEVWHFADKRHLVHFSKSIFRLERSLTRGILSIGLSPFLMNLCSSAVIILINQSLNKYGGDMAVGAYGIVNRIGFLIFMVVMGFNQGMQPIAGYNYGAKRCERVVEVLKYTIFCATIVTTSGFLVSWFMPTQVASLFTTDQELIDLASEGLQIVFCLFPIVGFQMVTANFFQSIGMAKKAIFLSLARQLLFLIPFLLIFPHLWGTKGVWMTMPAADLVASLISGAILIRQLKQFKKINRPGYEK